MTPLSEIDPRPIIPEPVWLRWWRAHPTGIPFVHVETKGAKKRTRRERKAGKP